MHKGMKIAIAAVMAALILVIGLIILTGGNEAEKPAAANEPTVTGAPQTEADAAAQTGAQDDPQAAGAKQAQSNDAQDDLYEGALAGLTEDEIAALALAEEAAGGHAEGDEASAD